MERSRNKRKAAMIGKNEAVAAGETTATPKKRRRRFVWNSVKVRILYRTWWRHGSGTKLLHCEIGEETRLVRVPVEDTGAKEVAK